MKKICLNLMMLLVAVSAMGQSAARTFTLNLTKDGASALTCYLPKNPTGRAVVCCPGGGYEFVNIDYEGNNWAPFFNNKGIAVFVLKYRLPHGDRSLPIGDAEKAMKLVRDSAAQWNIKTSEVGIMGSSAGGHLASTLCTHSKDGIRPDFAILFYPVITMGKGCHEGSRNALLGKDVSNPTVIMKYSNETQVKKGITPATLILVSTDDELVPPVENSIAYYEAMLKAGNSCTLFAYPRGAHGLFKMSVSEHKQMLSDISNWLDNLQK